ncbi:hypothetical protein BST81_07100 [Leptolyngbya sp. 'hensonii']|nr:hypothetical protein BST81_07100 [Leptolyngbya sp. 'hensonii']
MRFICYTLLFISLLWSQGCWCSVAQAGPLADRLSSFPAWRGKPVVQAVSGDLFYPDWIEGTWMVTSTLVDQVAPLSPKLTTPGFERNRQFLNQPIQFQVRFVPAPLSKPAGLPFPPLAPLQSRQIRTQAPAIVSDRAFNGLNLSRAYLGAKTVLAVKVDPASPNRQITLLSHDRQLISIVTGRAGEAPEPDLWITTEVFQQVFRGMIPPYFNEVENTTAYHRLPTTDPAIEADQVTAVYLSPQDPHYFEAGNSPVALYRYRLEFSPVGTKPKK